MAYNLGLTGPYDFDGVIANDFFAAAVLYYANRYPLVTRLPNVPVTGLVVKQVDDAFRPTSTAINEANNIDNAVNSVTVDDGSFFLPGDVIQIEDELCLVTEITDNTLSITRGHAASTAAAHNDNTTVHLIGNTRTGSEVDQNALTRVLDNSLTYPQTVQHPYQIGGSTEASSPAMAIPSGFVSMVGYQRAKSIQEVFADFERSALYGAGAALAADTSRPMMNGLYNRLTTNKTTSPTNSSAYKPSDLQRDLVSSVTARGGQPDVIVCSPDWQTGFAVWGLNLESLSPGDTSLGVDIRTFVAPGLGGLAVIFDPQLRTGSAFSLTSSEVSFGWKREPQDYPRGRRGDAIEGDVIGEGCLIVNNEAMHAWVSGVTGFSKQA